MAQSPPKAEKPFVASNWIWNRNRRSYVTVSTTCLQQGILSTAFWLWCCWNVPFKSLHNFLYKFKKFVKVRYDFRIMNCLRLCRENLGKNWYTCSSLAEWVNLNCSFGAENYQHSNSCCLKSRATRKTAVMLQSDKDRSSWWVFILFIFVVLLVQTASSSFCATTKAQLLSHRLWAKILVNKIELKRIHLYHEMYEQP